MTKCWSHIYFCFSQHLSKWLLEPQFTADVGLAVFHFSLELLSPFLMMGTPFALFLCWDTAHILLTPAIQILRFLELPPLTFCAGGGGGWIFCTCPLPTFWVLIAFPGLQDARSKGQLLLMTNMQLAAHPSE